MSANTVTTVALLLLGTSLAAQQPERPEPQYPKPSVFVAERVPRDPFQKIELRNLPQQVPVVTAAPADTLSGLFRVSAVSIDRLSIAIINQKAFVEDEWFRLRSKDKLIDVHVLKVRDNAVQLDCGGTVVTVPVTRKKTSLQEQAE